MTQFPRAVGVGLALLASACRTDLTLVAPAPGWERMDLQRRANAYNRSEVFADGKVMQAPPEGAVRFDVPVRDEAIETGATRGEPVRGIPISVDVALVRLGADRFDVYCALCHGVAGDGESSVAAKMKLRSPPSLLDVRYRNYASGQIFQVIGGGYGLMPSYAAQLTVDERWAVVAYVRALQVSRGVAVTRLPQAVRRALDEAAP
jgi:mono/diheme cytochrome c family protein